MGKVVIIAPSVPFQALRLYDVLEEGPRLMKDGKYAQVLQVRCVRM